MKIGEVGPNHKIDEKRGIDTQTSTKVARHSPPTKVGNSFPRNIFPDHETMSPEVHYNKVDACDHNFIS